MLTNIFLRLIEISISSSFIIMFLVVLRLLFIKRLPRLFFYALWLVLLIRLLVPVTITTPVNILNFTGIHTHIQDFIKSSQIIDAEVDDQRVSELGVIINERQEIGSEKKRLPLILPKEELSSNPYYNYGSIRPILLSYIWLFITVAFLTLFTYMFFKVKKHLSDATIVGANATDVYESDKLSSPILMGLFSPRIILPLNLKVTEDEASMILAHERHHLKRKDNILKPLAMIALCIHWFNPFVWLFYIYFIRDMEISCDEAVLRQNVNHRKDHYANTLLSVAEHSNQFFYGGILAFGENDLTIRIKRILGYKKHTGAIMILSAILLLFNSALIFGEEDDVAKFVRNYNLQSMSLESQQMTKEDIKAVIYTGKGAYILHFSTNTETGELWYGFSDFKKQFPLIGWSSSGGGRGQWHYYEEELNTKKTSFVCGGDSELGYVFGSMYKSDGITDISVTVNENQYFNGDIHVAHLKDDVYLWYTLIPFGTRDHYLIEYYNKDGQVMMTDTFGK